MSQSTSKRSSAFLDNALNGDGKAWGVEKGGGVVYECMFVEATARRLAQINDQMSNADWQSHRALLEREGFDLADPACAKEALQC